MKRLSVVRATCLAFATIALAQAVKAEQSGSKEIHEPLLILHGVDATAANMAPFLNLPGMEHRTILAVRPDKFSQETTALKMAWYVPGKGWEEIPVTPAELGASSVDECLSNPELLLSYAERKSGAAFDVLVPSMPNFSLNGFHANATVIKRWIDAMRGRQPKGYPESYEELSVPMRFLAHSKACPEIIMAMGEDEYASVTSEIFLYDPAFGSIWATLADSIPFAKRLRATFQSEIDLARLEGLTDLKLGSPALGEVFEVLAKFPKNVKVRILRTRSGVAGDREQGKAVEILRSRGVSVEEYGPEDVAPVKSTPDSYKPGEKGRDAEFRESYDEHDRNLGYVEHTARREKEDTGPHGVLKSKRWLADKQRHATDSERYADAYVKYIDEANEYFDPGRFPYESLLGEQTVFRGTPTRGRGIRYVVAEQTGDEEYGEWVFVPDPDFPGWLIGSKVEGVRVVSVPVYLWEPAASPDSVAQEIKSRNDREQPDRLAAVVIYGDPKSQRNRALRKALSNLGYRDELIHFIDGHGNLYAADGTLVTPGFVNTRVYSDPREIVAEATHKLDPQGYGVVPESGTERRAGDYASDGSPDESPDGNEDNGNKPPEGKRKERKRRQDDFPPPPPPFPPPPLPPPPPPPVSSGTTTLPPPPPRGGGGSTARPAISAQIKNPPPPRNSAAGFGTPMPRIPNPPNTRPWSRDIGGVLLQGAASVGDSGPVQVELGSGNFSLVVGGQSARVAPQAFRKFVTALWAVYFSRTEPGISIDPIAPGIDKHLVRYIGKVINTDLGRVMRETDYQMKKWAIGTERPDIPGFRNPDDIAASHGVVYVGAMSRLWLVPEDMRFKRGGDLLLFDSGRMRVKTEFAIRDAAGLRADPANEEFADWFTKNYEAVAGEYPIYAELFEYAKLVGLAQYLKESRVPLLWFLMANKDAVLTEESAGTVDALERKSKYFNRVHISGGVDLATRGEYKFDEAAVAAVGKALVTYPLAGSGVSSRANTARYIPGMFTFDLGERSYSVVPQYTLTSGRDRRGIWYQTDLAFRTSGFEITADALRDIRNDSLRLMVARRLQPAIEKMSQAELEGKIEALYAEAWEESEGEIGEIIARLERLQGSVYTDEEMFARAVDDALADQGRKRESDVGSGEKAGHARRDATEIGLTLRGLVNELKLMVMKRARFASDLELVRYSNPGRREGKGEFGRGWHLLIPYHLRPAGDGKRDFLNARIFERMEVENLMTGDKELLTFSEDRHSVAGYVPDNVDSSQFIILMLLSDHSYRLVDRMHNEFQFDAGGYLTDIILSEDFVVHLDYLDGLTEEFEPPPYRLEPDGAQEVEFGGFTFAGRMRVKDLVSGSSETLAFSDAGMLLGYVPENKEASRYDFLAVLTDRSFRLLDKEGKEATFTPDGRFVAMGGGTARRMVQSISMGNHKIAFRYTIDDSGSLVIASANLSRDRDVVAPAYVVRYAYGNAGTLIRVDGPSGKSETEVASVRRQ